MSYLEQVVAQAREADAGRERSQQKEPGWSDMSGCRAYMGFELAGTWASDDPDEWGAIRGTWLHEQWAAMRRAVLPERDYGWDVEVSYGGIKGHADEVGYTAGEVTDLKTTTLRSAKLWDDPQILDERFVQPMGYAAGVMETERWTFSAPDGRTLKPLVRMLVVPVDGTFADWRVFERPFDRDVADQALERYASVVQMQAEGLELPRDKPYYFCERWCEFFRLCRGEGAGDGGDLPEITDPELAAAVERYGLAMEAAGEAKRAQELYGGMIRGLRGTARGWRVSMTRPGAGKRVPDLEAIGRDYEASGYEVPTVAKPGSAPSLNVTRVKDS